MNYRHRDRANVIIPTAGAVLLCGLDALLVLAGPGGMSWTVRLAILGGLGLMAMLAGAAVRNPERVGWLLLFAGYGLFTIFPPDALVPGRVILGAILLCGMLGLLVWHARRRRNALWAKE
jgi:hypothetical protein